MRLSFIIILFLLATNIVNGQSERRVLTGKITDGTKGILNVHIINETTHRGTISDESGEFSIYAAENDVIRFTDIQFKPKKIKVSQDHFKNGLNVKLKVKNNELDEVVVETKNMAEQLGLPNAGKEPLTPLERKINYIKKGGLIDKIYAMITGEKKKLKKLQKLYEEERREVDIQLDIQMIRNHFQDDFFVKTIGISKEQIDAFIRFCYNDLMMYYFNHDRYVDIIDIFVKNKPVFLTKQLNSATETVTN